MRAAGFGVGGECWSQLACGFAAQLAEQARRNDQRTTEDDRRAVGDVPHRLEFLLAALQPAFEVVDGAPGVFEVQPHVLARLPGPP